MIHDKVYTMSYDIKKMKQGMSYSCKEKTIILNVFKYFRRELPDKCVTDIVRRTSQATGCSSKSIFQFRKEEASVDGFKEPSKTKIRKNINLNSRDLKYDTEVRQGIKNIIYDLKYKCIVTSLKTILEQINRDDQLPNFSIMTLRRLLFDMGFYYEKNGNKSILVEKTDVEPANKDSTSSKKRTKIKKLLKADKTTSNTSPVNRSTQNNLPKKSEDLQKCNIHYQNTSNNPVMGSQYNVQNHFLVPMHLSHTENHGYMMSPLSTHNRPMVINPRMPPPHMVQTPWMHTQPQPSLATAKISIDGLKQY